MTLSHNDNVINSLNKERTMNNITVYGLDIAKNVFHVCGMSERGKVLIRKRLRRDEVLSFFATIQVLA